MASKLTKVKNIAKGAKLLDVKDLAVKGASRVLMEVVNNDMPLPNIPAKAKEESKVWHTLTEYNGFKLQQNVVTQHARILDSNNVRIKWGTMEGMDKAFDRMIERMEKNRNAGSETAGGHETLVAKLKEIKDLNEQGIITDEEYEEIRMRYVEKLKEN